MLRAVELTTPENYSYYRVMMMEELTKRTVGTLNSIPELQPDVSLDVYEKILCMLLIDVGCKYRVFWQRCAQLAPREESKASVRASIFRPPGCTVSSRGWMHRGCAVGGGGGGLQAQHNKLHAWRVGAACTQCTRLSRTRNTPAAVRIGSWTGAGCTRMHPGGLLAGALGRAGCGATQTGGGGGRDGGNGKGVMAKQIGGWNAPLSHTTAYPLDIRGLGVGYRAGGFSLLCTIVLGAGCTRTAPPSLRSSSASDGGMLLGMCRCVSLARTGLYGCPALLLGLLCARHWRSLILSLPSGSRPPCAGVHAGIRRAQPDRVRPHLRGQL